MFSMNSLSEKSQPAMSDWATASTKVNLPAEMAVDHRVHAAEVGDDEALVMPFVFEHVGEQPVVDVVRRAIDARCTRP